MAQLNVKPSIKKQLERIKEEIAEELGVAPSTISHSDLLEQFISRRPKSKKGRILMAFDDFKQSLSQIINSPSMNGDINNIVEIFKVVTLRSCENEGRRKEYIKKIEALLDEIRTKYEENGNGEELHKHPTGKRP